MSFSRWWFCGWPNYRAVSPKFDPSLQVPIGNSQMLSREQGQGREQLGTLPPGEVHQERLSDWVSLVTFCPFPRNTLFTIARPPCWKNSPAWAFVLAGLGTGNRWWVFCILFSLCGVLCMELVRYGASHTVKYSLTLVLYAPEPSILTYLSQNDFCLPVYLWCINLLTLTWVNNHLSNCWFIFIIYLFIQLFTFWTSFPWKMWTLLILPSSG